MKREGMRQQDGQWVRFIDFIFTKLWSRRQTIKQHNHHYLLQALFLFGVFGLTTSFAYAAKPVFLIKPITKAPAVLYLGETATANYLVTNNTPYVLKNNGLSQLPAGISQSGGSCRASFDLAPGQNCSIQLTIIADRLSGDVHGGPIVCNTINNPVYCARPTQQDGLEIKKINTPPPTNPPSVPQNIMANINIAADGSLSARVTWDPPKSDGGLPIVGYLVTANSNFFANAGSCSTDATHRDCTINGLNPGTRYVFSVAAINTSGKGQPAPSPSVTTPTAPFAPMAVTAVANGNGTVAINWTAPSDGGSTITGYTVSSSPDNVTCSTSGATNCTYSTLTPGSSYSFTVTATNAIGVGPASEPTSIVNIPAVPGAPTSVVATVSGDGAGTISVSINWVAPIHDGGTAISGYTVTPSPLPSSGSTTCSTSGATSCTFTNLTQGSTYSFVVTAENSVGSGMPSSASNTIRVQDSQTISFTSSAPSNAVVAGSSYLPSATASSGLTVSFSIDTASAGICSLSGGALTYQAVGNCILNANQTGDNNYLAATQVQQTISVGKGSQSINYTSTAPSAAVVAGATYTPTATVSSGLTVTLSVDAASSSVCSLSAGTVSFIGAGTCTLNANQAGDSNYNAATQLQQSFTVGKGSQTISYTSTAPSAAVVAGATYTPTATASSGFTVALSVDASSSSVCSMSAGVVSFIGAGTCTLNADQAGDSNYNAAPQLQQSFTVGKGSQTISYTSTAPSAAVVAGATYTPTATVSSGLTVTLSVDAASSAVCSMSAGVVSFIGAGTCTINANQAGDSNYNAATQLQQSFTVGKGSQTISYTSTAPSAAVVAGATYTPTATVSSGLTVTLSVDAASSSVCSLSAGTVSFIGAGTCTLNANQAGDSNYNAATQLQQSFTVGKGSQTISYTSTAPSAAVVAGATYTPTATATSGLTVTLTVDAASSAVCSMSAGTVSFIGAGTCTINANQAGDSNYNAATQLQQSFTVGKGSQTISYTSTAPSAAVVAGATYTPTATATSGLTVTLTVDASSSSVCSMSAGVVSFNAVGTCTINANQAGNANYNAATQLQQSFTVAKGSQTISYTSTAPSAAVVAGATYTPTATATSGLTVTLTVDASSSSVCSMSAGVVSFNAVGTCTINANQAGNANYNAATQLQQSFTVGKGSQTISYTSTAPSAAVVAGATYTPTATTTSGLTVTLTVDVASSSVCSMSAGVVSFIGAGTCTINANQAGNSNYNAATQLQQSFTVGKGSQTVSYTSTAPSAAVVAGATYTPAATATSGLTVALTVDASSSSICSMSAGVVSFIGAGTCTINANQAGNANYNAATQVQQSFTVAKGSQTISYTSTAPSLALVGGTTYTPTATASSGLVVTITVDATSSSVCSISGGVVSFNAVGTCTLNANQAGNANYNAATQVQQSFSVITTPGAPTGATAVAGNGLALVSWTAPASTGGASISSYQVTSSPGGLTCSISGLARCKVTGLSNGTSYTFSVTATNSAGAGPASTASNAVVPFPDPTTTQLYSSLNPAAVGNTVTLSAQVTSVNGFLSVGTVSFFNGGVAISGCSNISVVSGSASCSTSFASAATNTITATYNGTTANSASTSAAFSQYSVAAISQVTLSTSPRQVTAIPGDSQVVVRWLPPFNTGGQAITGYSVTYGPTTASPTSSSYQTVGCSTTGGLSCTVTGLTNGTAYTFRVLAVNSSGNGIPSYSSSVKPGSAVLVSPSTLALSGLGSGIYRAFTLTNATLFPVTITQTPTTSDFSPALPTGTTLYTTTCTIDTVLNPGNSCSVTLKPGSVASAMSSPNTASACTANVAGRTAPAANVIQLQTDAGTISAQVLVLGYGCTYQSGYVFSIDDSVANILSVAGKVAATGDQGANKIWASNGAGSAITQVSLDLIPGIDYTSTGAAASPTGAAFVSFFSSYYTNANPFATASFIACEGKMDGQCNSYNTVLFYNQLVTNYNNSGSPKFTASAGPTNTSYYAAGLCVNTISSYNDWYLPAICEMGYDQYNTGTGCGSSGAPFMQNIQSNLITYNSLNLLNAFSASYYSSSEFATVSSNNPRTQACGQQFDPDDTYVAQSPFTKNNQALVRCVRLFTH
ncbi:MAG: fibronectin type III domain-containing protein [Legionella sp.]|uniref:fibronectin type III domain-containing protein n=1 Tax=Legionella sp. TaxID=459 RepID=UPI0028489342|nr:fibronectin type III domain-containing protein [Legionella sp.]